MSSNNKQIVAWAYRKLGGDVNDFNIESINKPIITNQNDLLIKNVAVSLNPTDQKSKTGAYGNTATGEALIGGRDASGVIESIGNNVKGFKIGDEVFYAGDNTRPGSFSEYTLVDYRIVGLKPKTISHQQAASLPLTSITVWEGFYEKLHPQPGQRVLVTAAAGGVGSIAVQLLKIWGLQVTGTASRPESVEWVKNLGADEVIDHSKDLEGQVKGKFDYVFNCHDDSLLDQIAKVIKPRGHIVFILPFFRDNNAAIRSLFMTSVSLHFEMMFSRSMFKYEEEKQGELLNIISKLIDDKKLKPTNNKIFQWADFKQAFTLLESGKTIGKTIVNLPQ